MTLTYIGNAGEPAGQTTDLLGSGSGISPISIPFSPRRICPLCRKIVPMTAELRLSDPGDARQWKRTRADLIDGRFFRSTGLVTHNASLGPGATAPSSALLVASADQDALFDPEHGCPAAALESVSQRSRRAHPGHQHRMEHQRGADRPVSLGRRGPPPAGAGRQCCHL